MNDEKRFAVLIDIENISPKYIRVILDEVSNYGNITIKRAYGDWTKPAASSWREKLLENSIIPMQQFNNTFGKNSSDSALIIDAMNILYRNNVDGFCLVSSDSDFTRLAANLKEEGKMVIGMGESKTPNALVNACDCFKYVDVLYKDSENADKLDEKSEEKGEDKPEEKSAGKTKKTGKTPAANQKKSAAAAKSSNTTKLSTIEKSIHQIIEANGDDEGMNISLLKSNLQRRFPDFDTRNYGTAKFSKFLAQFRSLKLTESGRSTNVNIV